MDSNKKWEAETHADVQVVQWAVMLVIEEPRGVEEEVEAEVQQGHNHDVQEHIADQVATRRTEALGEVESLSGKTD